MGCLERRREQPQPPKLLAQVAVSLLWGIVPLSWIYAFMFVALRVRQTRLLRLARRDGKPTLFGRRPRLAALFNRRRLFVWSVVEVAFSLYYQYLVRRVQKRNPILSRETVDPIMVRVMREAILDNLEDPARFVSNIDAHNDIPIPKASLAYDDPCAVAFRREMSGWFMGMKPEHITRADVLDWLACFMFDKRYDEVLAHDTRDGAMQELLAEVLHTFEARRGLPFAESAPPGVERKRPMLLTLDPVHVHTRPLMLYVMVTAMNRAVEGYFRLHGVRRCRHGSLSYLLYVPRGWRPEAVWAGKAYRPILFLHGLGLGLSEYALALRALLRPHGQPAPYPVVIPLQPWMSYEFFSPRFLRPWHHVEAPALLHGILTRHGFDKCHVSILSHSMGTIVHAWLMRAWPKLIARSVFVDPVCFQLWEPHICYRFLYKPTESFVEFVLRYFAARELGNANLLTRHFDWSSNVLLMHDVWKHHTPDDVRIYLAGDDTVLHAWRVLHLLKRCGLQDSVHYAPALHHGELMMLPNHRVPEMIDVLIQ